MYKHVSMIQPNHIVLFKFKSLTCSAYEQSVPQFDLKSAAAASTSFALKNPVSSYVLNNHKALKESLC